MGFGVLGWFTEWRKNLKTEKKQEIEIRLKERNRKRLKEKICSGGHGKLRALTICVCVRLKISR